MAVDIFFIFFLIWKKDIAPQKKQDRNFAPASLALAKATLGVIFVLPFCNTALYKSCLYYIYLKKMKKKLANFCVTFFENPAGHTESYKKILWWWNENDEQ